MHRALLLLLAAVLVLFSVLTCGSATRARAASDPSGEDPAPLTGYSTQYTEEFIGTALNGLDWAAYNNQTSTQPAGPRCSCNALVSDGVLHLRMTKVNGIWMGAGVSSRKVHTTYGQVQVRARYDHGAGTKAVALLWPEVGWPPEIDFFETTTDATHSRNGLTNHYGATNLMQHNYVAASPGWHTFVIPNYDTADWHTYGTIWTPDSVTYTVDGTTVAVQAGHAPNQRMWLGLQNGKGGAGPDASTPPTVDFDIDWVQFATADG
jgi:beta-glucanase (GH16 family)